MHQWSWFSIDQCFLTESENSFISVSNVIKYLENSCVYSFSLRCIFRIQDHLSLPIQLFVQAMISPLKVGILFFNSPMSLINLCFWRNIIIKFFEIIFCIFNNEGWFFLILLHNRLFLFMIFQHFFYNNSLHQLL